jgi:hypothetical protein
MNKIKAGIKLHGNNNIRPAITKPIIISFPNKLNIPENNAKPILNKPFIILMAGQIVKAIAKIIIIICITVAPLVFPEISLFDKITSLSHSN